MAADDPLHLQFQSAEPPAGFEHPPHEPDRPDARVPWLAHRPPADARRPSLTVLRSSRADGQKLTFAVLALSETVSWAATHYSGRTMPCVQPHASCPECERGVKIKFAGYFAAWSTPHGRQVLCELTAGADAAIADWHAQHGSLRGAEVRLSRQHDKPNALLIVEIRRARATGPLPPPADVPEALSRLWRWDERLIRCRQSDRGLADVTDHRPEGRR